MQDRHAAYFCDRAVTLGRATGGTDQHQILDAIDADIDNYRSAFGHLLTTGKINDAARGILTLRSYWQIRRTREGLRWSEQLLTYPDLDAHRRIHALADAARAENHVGDVHRAERKAAEAVQLAETAGVDAPYAAFEALMGAALWRRDPAAYRRWWERGHQVVASSGQRYLLLLVEAQRGTVPGAWDERELIEHHERLQLEIDQHGDPMLVFLWAITFAAVLHHAGQLERARDIAHSAIEPGRRAGPISHCAALLTAAAVDLSGETNDYRARVLAAESLRIASREGLTNEALLVAFVAAALAARRGDIDRSAVLLAGLNRHAEAVAGHPLIHACRDLAQNAVDAHNRDLTAAQRRGEAMTLDDLIAYTMDTLK